MPNLNKYTKAELISKFKKLENKNSNQTLIFKLLDYIIYFKSLIIKFTLIGLIIRWIKKYSLLQKFWHIFSIISSSLLGFSAIEVYSWDIISWIKDTSIYNWYINLFNSYKNELSKENNPFEFQKNRISEGSIKVANGIQEEINSNNRSNNRNIIEEINNNKPESLRKEYISTENQLEDNNDKTNYKKYFLIGSMLIVSGITIWCYFNDIKPGDAANTVIEKIKSSRSWFNSDQNNIINNNTGNNQMNISTNINSSNADIQLSDNTQPIASSSKVSPDNYQNIASTSKVLTSPSLENLNVQAETSWGESSSSTISSPDSDRTVTQVSTSSISSLMPKIWRTKLPIKVNDKINFIESSLNSSDNKLDNGPKLADYYAYIINEYNIEIETYNFMKSDSTSNNIEILNNQKEWLYYFREWIAEYHNKILPDSSVTIEIGTINDSPKILSKDIV